MALGKLGGTKGGAARAAALSPAKRKTIAKKAQSALGCLADTSSQYRLFKIIYEIEDYLDAFLWIEIFIVAV